MNKTALPLVFRQEGVPCETAGQFEEHEIARMVAPLIFSLTDPEASPTIVARLGSGVHPESVPQVNVRIYYFLAVKHKLLKILNKNEINCQNGNKQHLFYYWFLFFFFFTFQDALEITNCPNIFFLLAFNIKPILRGRIM